MGSYLDIKTLANLVRNKRDVRSLRETAKGIGNVSISTISRVENGKTPDVDTFLALCDWLAVSPTELIKNTEEQEAINTPKNYAVRLTFNDIHLILRSLDEFIQNNQNCFDVKLMASVLAKLEPLHRQHLKWTRDRLDREKTANNDSN